ncbi:MacB family efflux pump subunit [Paracoccus siganidrum]|uniref:Pyoverdine export ATP-binding/permease protein PvdT n=1 Tax=Paracoccus siganidrum TaxID=1276757 RepID=A0A419A9J9_9RHOB|nr:MacB family efflux pump subunit [Paracoccus siganidrum]RJL19112.1 MacB family efflux pump subunit [Paracoccus siganidrum]RMC40413.1 macrolide ABC transporter permease/ATP-binding protein MacB [Paracoccus siganidrum]
MSAGGPIIELRGVGREYPAGENTVTVLRDIDLTIRAGEFVAVIGASGSGKSTLMNIIGCLDRPSAGSYRIKGRETARLDPDELAALRRESFGFIFQRYHLLGELTALGNAEIPAIYAGESPASRRARAGALLDRLGMAERSHHLPGQLSGGQQQRVSIARALMNNAEVILADEPTGALDSQSGQEVLRILEELHAEGRTVVIVTHDPTIAARAERVIEISDGRIIRDSGAAAAPGAPEARHPPASSGLIRALWTRFTEAFRMAVLSMRAHKLRSFLTMLGIIIGIASVVSVVALGEGSRQKVLENISGLGTNTLEIFAGRDFGDMRSGRITTLVVADAQALSSQSYVAAVTPTVNASATLRFGATAVNAQLRGVGEQYFDATGTTISQGRAFDAAGLRDMAQDVVIDENTRASLFPDESVDPIGQVVLADNVMLRVIGVASTRQMGPGGGQSLSLYLPYTTVQARFLGSTSLASITVRVADDVDTALAEQAVEALLTQRHGTKDFFIVNTDEIRQTITATTRTLSLLIAAIAVISLLVGGIGVMNIMLVSVSERVAEIGVRMAVGARRSDIMQQFLIEAVLVCMIGGVLGIAAALGFGAAFGRMTSEFALVYSSGSILAAVASASLIGVAFGFLPARNASRLDPVAALAKG